MKAYKTVRLSDDQVEKLEKFAALVQEADIISDEDLEDFGLKRSDEEILNEYLLRYLRYADFDVDQAFKVIKKSFDLKNKIRNTENDFFHVPFEIYKEHYEKGIAEVLKHRDPNGAKIIWVRAKNWNGSITEEELKSYMAASFHYMDEALFDVENQENGGSVIVDLSNFSIWKTAKLISLCTLDRIKLGSAFIQGSYPIKIQQVHMIHIPFLAVSFYQRVVRYFIKKGLRSRIHLHYGGADVLSKYFDTKTLPKSLKGKIPDDDAIDYDILESLYKRHGN